MNRRLARKRVMESLAIAAVLFIGLIRFAGAQTHVPPAHLVTHGVFVDIPVFRPAGQVQQFVLLFTGDAAPTSRDHRLVQWMVGEGAMVVVVPVSWLKK